MREQGWTGTITVLRELTPREFAARNIFIAGRMNDDSDSLLTGSRLPRRIAEVSAEHGINVEVFVFGAAQHHLSAADTDCDRQFNTQIDELIASGIQKWNTPWY
jgi:hypothetical protein